ncbi:hypothetical protein ACHAW5_005340 [Stephanodiscus triporus]|uniref:Uncharacterized protein n=1 Tax=Stephanodiscus triporus TaxID=2934178 RepID=A0ABD3NKN2_9STRA
MHFLRATTILAIALSCHHPVVVHCVKDLDQLALLGHCQKSGCRNSPDRAGGEVDADEPASYGVRGARPPPASSSAGVGGLGVGGARKYSIEEKAAAPPREYSVRAFLAELASVFGLLMLASHVKDHGALPTVVGGVDWACRSARRVLDAARDVALSSFGNSNGGGGKGGRRLRQHVSTDSAASLGSLADLISADSDDNGRRGSENAVMGDEGGEALSRSSSVLSMGSSDCYSEASSYDSESSCGTGGSMSSADGADATDVYDVYDTSRRAPRRASLDMSELLGGRDNDGGGGDRRRDSEYDSIISKFLGYLSRRSGQKKKRDPPQKESVPSLEENRRRRSIDRPMLHHRRNGGGGGIMGELRGKRRSTLDNLPSSASEQPATQSHAPRSGGLTTAVPLHHAPAFNYFPIRKENATTTNEERHDVAPEPSHWPRPGGHHDDNHHQQQQQEQKHQQQQQRPQQHQQHESPKHDGRQDDFSVESFHPHHRHLDSSVSKNQTITLQDLLGKGHSSSSSVATAADCGKSVADSMTEINLSSIA